MDEQQKKGNIGAFDRQTIIELSGNVIDEIAKKYVNIRKGVGDIMGGALLGTRARTIRDEGINQGEMLLASLISRLFEDGRVEDAKLASNVSIQ